ncbi:DUF935 domain-containing protein [Ancylobacter defluvii]|uniref:DUF935 domain-containing protein n=1 Tax=Ancylobacter defluvii TaxID=1282440 RepID=A0A9W6K1D0_9HYPH|nr:DUF935 domain-containing protein [Ancylobacter defluvii]MBS7586418.1 DUF935 domain-containing protein [Ancylobacter defluvii]GLK85699.1 hypothetical protein GCM10017653_37690 [Ancylobacter defluvii]
MARFSPILDIDGKPIDKAALLDERKAVPTLTGVRSPISGHPADGLRPDRLAAIHRAAASGDPLRYFELAEDIEERDPHYLAVLSTRKRQVSQIPVTVVAAGEDSQLEEHADFVRQWLATNVLAESQFDMLDAIGKGLSILEIEWEARPGWVTPRCLHWCDPRWFALDDVSLDEPLLYDANGTKEPLDPNRYVVHRHKAKSGLSIRGGLARIASWSWMYKAFTLRDWNIFVQNYGMPIRIGKYDGAASEADKETVFQAVRSIAGDLAAIIPASMSIEFVEVKNAADGSALYEKRADWMDRQISKLVLGQTATTDAAPGSHAIGSTHRLVQEDLERFDAALLSATLNRQLIRKMVAFTFGPQEKYPTLVIGRPDELPIGVVVEALAKLGPLGLEVEESQVLDRLGFTAKAESVDGKTGGKPVRVIGGRAPAPAPVPADPAVPPAKQPPAQPPTLHGRLLASLIELHAAEPDHVELLTNRLSAEAAGAIAGLSLQVRSQFEAASDMTDLMARIDRLKLDAGELREVMGRAMALAYMVGQAAIVDEMRHG